MSQSRTLRRLAGAISSHHEQSMDLPSMFSSAAFFLIDIKGRQISSDRQPSKTFIRIKQLLIHRPETAYQSLAHQQINQCRSNNHNHAANHHSHGLRPCSHRPRHPSRHPSSRWDCLDSHLLAGTWQPTSMHVHCPTDSGLRCMLLSFPHQTSAE